MNGGHSGAWMIGICVNGRGRAAFCAPRNPTELIWEDTWEMLSSPPQAHQRGRKYFGRKYLYMKVLRTCDTFLQKLRLR